MSEEEKQAIETIHTIVEFGGDNLLCREHRERLQTVLNLIDKQQKKIKDFKKQINMKKVMVKNMPKDVELILMYKNDFDRNFGSNYISKDKIKQKIKELERLNKEQEIPVLKEYKFIRKEMIKYFKELIGEE